VKLRRFGGRRHGKRVYSLGKAKKATENKEKQRTDTDGGITPTLQRTRKNAAGLLFSRDDE
jgi:hypothetical protein